MKNNKLAFLIPLLFGLLVSPADADDWVECAKRSASSVASCQRLADSGNAEGMLGLAMLYLEGNVMPQDYEKSFQLMLRAAQLGNKDAQVRVAQAYARGQGTARDDEEAYAWFLVAKENNHELAQPGIDNLTRANAIKPGRIDAITQHAKELRAATRSPNGFKAEPKQAQKPMSELGKYCDTVMTKVDTVIKLKKYNRSRSEAELLIAGVNDAGDIRMLKGIIEWVWSTAIPAENMHDAFNSLCLKQSADVAYVFK